MRKLLFLVFLLWFAPPGWASDDPFCGPGPHPKTSACRCRDCTSSALCACNSGEETAASFTRTLRETLPAAVTYVLAEASRPPGPNPGPGRTEDDRAPSLWSQAPLVPPPR